MTAMKPRLLRLPSSVPTLALPGLPAGAALGAVLALAPGLLHAQAAMTLYGVVDMGVVYNANAGAHGQTALTSGVAGSSRWGLTGAEDLGGGTRAIFTLESGFAADTGAIAQNGTLFGRQAFVGLTGNAGALTLGRQYSSAYWYTGWLTSGGSWAASGAGYGAHAGDVDNLDTFARVNNAVKYTTPKFGGFELSGTIGLGERAGSAADNRIVAIGGGYGNGPFSLGIGYQIADRPNFSLFGNKANDSSTGTNIFTPIYSGYASADKHKVFSTGAAYTLNKATFGLVYSNVRFTDLGAVTVAGLPAGQAAYRGNAEFNTGELNFKYQLTPALMLGLAYWYTRTSGPRHAEYQQVNAGLDYTLSRRTDLYAFVFHQRAAGTDSRGVPAVAAIAGATASSGAHQTLAAVGIRHKF